MKDSIKEELELYIQDLKDQNILNEENKEDWHHLAFNEDYYIIGYYNADKWLEKHELNAFDAIDQVLEYEIAHFGEITTDVNSEAVVNMLAYIYGEELINN